jgi:hypothetical protein
LFSATLHRIPCAAPGRKRSEESDNQSSFATSQESAGAGNVLERFRSSYVAIPELSSVLFRGKATWQLRLPVTANGQPL